eukprot:6491649-Amphidinium_carterae.2
MAESRVITNRRTQRLEQVEASAQQLEVMVSRERDELYDQLMQTLSSHANQTGAQPSSASPALQTPARAAGATAPVPQAYSAPAPNQVQQTTPSASGPSQPQGEANPFLMGTRCPQGSSGNPFEPLRQAAPGTNHSINPMTGLGYGFDPPTPLQTPGPMSQGALSQHFTIATPPHPQGLAIAPQSAVNPLIDPLTQADPWNNWSMQGSTHASVQLHHQV